VVRPRGFTRGFPRAMQRFPRNQEYSMFSRKYGPSRRKNRGG
jgi:hypothetical protein